MGESQYGQKNFFRLKEKDQIQIIQERVDIEWETLMIKVQHSKSKEELRAPRTR